VIRSKGVASSKAGKSATKRSLRYELRGHRVITPPPGYFGKRGCKLLKTKERSYGITTKRLQVVERSRVRAGVMGGVSEVSSR
jgi:hypothetical protein